MAERQGLAWMVLEWLAFFSCGLGVFPFSQSFLCCFSGKVIQLRALKSAKSQIRLELLVWFGGMYITDNVPFLSHDIKDTCYQHDLLLSCPDHLTEVVLVRFLHCKFSLLYLAYCPLWKKVAMSSPYLGIKNYAPTPPWRRGIDICCFEFFCMGSLPSLIYLFSCELLMPF